MSRAAPGQLLQLKTNCEIPDLDISDETQRSPCFFDILNGAQCKAEIEMGPSTQKTQMEPAKGPKFRKMESERKSKFNMEIAVGGQTSIDVAVLLLAKTGLREFRFSILTRVGFGDQCGLSTTGRWLYFAVML